MPAFIYQLLALLAGLVLPVQASINAKLRTGIGSPLGAAIISFLVGLVGLSVVFFVKREPVPSLKTLGSLPPYFFVGGFLGAFYVAAATVLFPRLGALQTTALVVGGQMVAGLILDHYGLLGMAVKPVDFQRVLAIGLILAGVWLSGK